jgi:hypothetical protein
MIAQEKRRRMMSFRPKPGISTKALKNHLSGRAFSEFTLKNALSLMCDSRHTPSTFRFFLSPPPTHTLGLSSTKTAAHTSIFFFSPPLLSHLFSSSRWKLGLAWVWAGFRGEGKEQGFDGLKS